MDEKESLEEDEEEYVIFSLEDDPTILDFLGKIISTDYARKFLKLTSEEEMNLKEIAKKITNMENPRIPNAVSWKKRLEKVGLIVCREKQQRRNGHILKYYKGKKITFIVKDKSLAEAIKNNKEFNDNLKSILQTASKLSIIAIVTVGTFMITDYDDFFGASDWNFSSYIPPLLFPLIVFCVSLIITKFYKKFRFIK